jgi:transposase-like protein
MTYSNSVKESVLRRILPPNNEKVRSVSHELGIPSSTITTWLYKARKNNSIPINKSVDKRYSLKDKYQILMKISSLNDKETGIYLRELGLHFQHLNVWNQELKDYMENKKPQEDESTSKLKKKIKSLEKEIQIKDKTLADMVTLIALKKKLDDYIDQREEF